MSTLLKIGHGVLALALLLVTVIVVLALAGCVGPDPRKVADLKDEIATLTSLALLNPNLTAEQRSRIARDGNAANAHVDEVTK